MEGVVSIETARRMQIDGATITVDRPERTLLALPLSTVRDHLEDIAIWLISLVVSRPALEEEWARTRRPVLIKRFAEMARDLGNERLARQLRDFLSAEHGEHVSRARAGVGSEVIVPSIVAPQHSGAPWLARHAVTFQRWADQITEVVADEAELPVIQPAARIRQAKESKAYDAYHSTTIEGYRITPEEVSAVIRGESVAGNDPEEVRARMAVKGYSAAFDRCMEMNRTSEAPILISEALTQDLHIDLFSPSVEIGILDADTLRGWRTQPAYLRGARYVPPSSDKVPQLMQQHTRLINEWDGAAVARATENVWVCTHRVPAGFGVST